MGWGGKDKGCEWLIGTVARWHVGGSPAAVRQSAAGLGGGSLLLLVLS